MRILRLDGLGGAGNLDLHPFLTVVSGCGETERAAVRDAVRCIARGDLAGVAALVEDGGTLVDLGAGGDPSLSVEGVDVVTFTELSDAAAGPAASPAELAHLDQLDKELEVMSVSRETVRTDFAADAAYLVAQLERDLERLGRRAELSEGTELVRDLLAVVDELPATIEVTSEAVEELLAAWRRHNENRQRNSNTLAELASAVDRAEARTLAANAEVRAALERAKPLLLSREDEQRLDELVIQAPSGRFARKKGPTPAEEAELAALLAKVNQPSYTAYQMFRLEPVASAEAQAAVRAAEQEFAAASEELSQAERAVSADPEVQALASEENRIRRAAEAYLGPAQPSDLEAALLAHVTTRPNPEWLAAVSSLRDAALQLGLAVPAEAAAETVAPLVAQLLAERESGAGLASSSEIEADLARHRERCARHDRAVARLAEIEQRFLMVQTQREALAAVIGERGPRQAAGLTLDELQLRLEGLTDALLAEAGRGAPVLVEGEFSGLSDTALVEVLDWMVARSDRLQFVVVTDRDAAAEHATGLGLQDALVVAPRSVG